MLFRSQTAGLIVVAIVAFICLGSVAIAQLAVGGINFDTENLYFATRPADVGLCTTDNHQDVQRPLPNSWFTEHSPFTTGEITGQPECVLSCGTSGVVFGLATWNIVAGAMQLISLVIVFVVGAFAAKGKGGGVLALALFVIPMSIFSFAWWIVGIIITARLEKTQWPQNAGNYTDLNEAGSFCKTNYRPLWDVTVAALVLQGIGICFQLGGQVKKKK